VRGVFVELRYRVEDREARARGTLGVVVMGLWIAEIGHHAVAKVLRDMPAKAFDCLRRRAMIPGDDFAPLFRIEVASYFGRADEIAEQYRQMAAFSCGYTTFNSDGCIGIIL
jgi:hypothetical protein